MTVSELREQLVEAGLTKAQADQIKGKENLKFALESTKTKAEEPDPLKEVFEEIDKIRDLIGYLSVRVNETEEAFARLSQELECLTSVELALVEEEDVAIVPDRPKNYRMTQSVCRSDK